MIQYRERIVVEGYTIYGVPRFKYLGVLLTQDNELKAQISRRIQIINKFYLGALLKSRTIFKILKIKMFMMLIQFVIIYSSETWTLKKNKKNGLEREILRRIYGRGSDLQLREQRKRYNVELQNLFQKPCITREITKRRLTWIKHVCRKNDTLIKAVIKENPSGKMPLGRPRLRQKFCVESVYK